MSDEPFSQPPSTPQQPQDQPPSQQPQDQPASQQQNQTPAQSQQMSQQQQALQQQQSSLPRTITGTGSADFLRSYVQPAGVYDENRDAKGQLRPHWHQLNQWIGQFGPDEMDRRWQHIRRMIHHDGIAYSSYGDPTDRELRLRLDPLPHLIPSTQWQSIESGLTQRAELLNMVLADIYGPQTLLKDGILPASTLFMHPHYQLPLHDVPPAGGKHLHFYAAELARAPSGDWWVMTDRTDAPGGSGFALENRIVMSRAFPNEFRRSNVQRLASYFIAMRDHLISLSPNNTENPHIAILTAGTGTSTYFEDAYLARYLGFTLVEVADLTVRGRRVVQKTLGGLVPIDVIVRRKHSNHLDPLEQGGSEPGIAGILQVARQGNVAIVNSPGSGLLESPVFMAFLPRICRALTGVDLALPGVATWWAGEAKSLETIADKIDDVVLRPAFRHRTPFGKSPQPPVDLSKLSRDERIKIVKANPKEWVAQEKVARSSAAVWEEGKLRPGYLLLRTFSVASGDSYQVMSGGLPRVAESVNSKARNVLQAGGTKDVWVLADKPVDQVTLLTPPGDSFASVRGRADLSSRQADNFCWLGRNLERTDATARLLRSVVVRLTGEADPAESRELPVLVRALAAEGRIDPGFAIDGIRGQLPALERILVASMLDQNDPVSLRSLVNQIFGLASKVRERMAPDAWRIVQEIGESLVMNDVENCDLAEFLEVADNLIGGIAGFSGLITESMTRTHGFGFLNFGRRLERSLQIIGLIKHCFIVDRPLTSELFEAVLEVADSIMTYRWRYFSNLQLSSVLDLLLADETNPRSLAFQLCELNRNIESLPGNQGPNQFSLERRLAMDALHTVRMTRIPELCKSYAAKDQDPLNDMLTKIENQLSELFVTVSHRFLVHTGAVHQLVKDNEVSP